MRRSIIVTIIACFVVMLGGAFALAGSRVHNNVSTLYGTEGHEQWKWVNHGHEVVDDQVFAPGVENTLVNKNDGANFYLTHSHTPQYNWNAWPTIFYGCWYNVCAQHGILPAPISKIHSMWLTDRTSFPRGAIANDAMDMWYSKTDNKGHHPNGAEIMIWVRWQHVGNAPTQLVTLGHHRFWFEHWTVHADGTSWNYLQFRLYHQSNDFTNFNAQIIVRYCEQHGYVRSHWWNMADDNGFEDVQHLQGANISQFLIRGF